jgi:uncharacterized damage-inducible protein DinB
MTAFEAHHDLMPAHVNPSTDERELLLGYLAQQRLVLRAAAFGLRDDQARLTPTAGALSIGGLLKHVATTESFWLDVVLQQNEPFSWDAAESYGDEFTMTDEESLDAILARYELVAERTESIVRSLPMDHPVPVPDAPWFPKDVDAWSLRWVLLHLIQETGRHAGHADIVRESVDGATGFELLAAAEDWPDEPWLRRWRPAEAVSAASA